MTDEDLMRIVQNHTGFPWFNGMAFVENKGIGFAARNFEIKRASLADDLSDLQGRLRKQRVYWAADRVRDLISLLDNFKDRRLLGQDQ